MKFLVSSGAFHKLLLQLNGVVSNNPVVPILENFLLQLTPGLLTVQASDLETTIVATMPIEGKETATVAVPARLLLDTLKSLPDQPLAITIAEDSSLVSLKSSNGNFRLAGENGQDYPRMPVAKGQPTLTLPSASLSRAIHKTVFAVSSDELRPAMTGILVELQPERTVFVATDGHRLLRYSRLDASVGRPEGGAGQPTSKVILPRKACQLLKGCLPGESAPVDVLLSNGNAFFRFNNLKLICRLIDERYPDYENVIPLSNPNILVISRAELLSSLKRISIYANKTTHQVRLRMEHAKVVVSAEDLDFSNEAQETLTCQYSGEPFEVGYNVKFLVEMLGNLDCEEISLAMSTPNRAALLTPLPVDKAEDVLMLVMPVMLNNYA